MIPFYEHKLDDFSGQDLRDGLHHLRCAAHLHYHIELVLLLEGETVCYADNERVRLRGGDVFLSFPNQIHRYESSGVERYFIFIVNPDLCPALAGRFTGSRPATARLAGAARDPEILALAERLTAGEPADDPFSAAARQGYLQVLFSRLLARMDLSPAAPGDAHAVKDIVRYCTQNFTRELSLSLLERELHISKYYISHLFSDKLRIGFNDYVNSLRVSYACRCLAQGDLSVTEISSLSGFGTLRTFNRAFQRETGKTPSEYRRAARAEQGREPS